MSEAPAIFPKLLVVDNAELAEIAKLGLPAFTPVVIPEQPESLLGFDVVFWPTNTPKNKQRAAQYAEWLLKHQVENDHVRIQIVKPPKFAGPGWSIEHIATDHEQLQTIVSGAKDVYFQTEPERGKPLPALSIVEDAPAIPFSTIKTLESVGVSMSNGKPVMDIDNVARVLRADQFLEKFTYDTFHSRIFTTYFGPRRPMTDSDYIALTITLQRDFGFQRVSKDTVRDAIIHMSKINPSNEPRDWMESLKWDGTKRISKFLDTYMLADPSDYTNAASRNFWISLAARIYRPGCKCDTVLILQGAQGIYKSTMFEIIGGPWYGVATADPEDHVKFAETLQGKLIMELAELVNFTKADAEAIKRLTSIRVDRFRRAYGHDAEDFPRQGIIVGTTNKSQFLTDETGARRFWPVRVHACDRMAMVRDREQLFAEAAVAFRAWESSAATGWEGHDDALGWWAMPASAAEAQEEARLHDELEVEIEPFLADHPEGVTLRQIWVDGLSNGLRAFDRREQMRLGKACRALGFENRVIRREEKTVRIWMPIKPPF